MNFSKNIFEIAERFMKDPSYVDINYEEIFYLHNDILLDKRECKYQNLFEDEFKNALIELIGCSINYCYFYGKSDIRPCESGSTKMGELLNESFLHYPNFPFDMCMNEFKEKLIVNRFPLLEERLKHLDELSEAENFIKDLISYKDKDVQNLMYRLIVAFPGFSSDIFLKRASLFFIQLYRRFGWFKDSMMNLHVPVDYQVPKMLKYFNAISYSTELTNMIDNDILIPKSSKIECEIRSATILSVKALCELTKMNVSDIDAYFFFKRHSCLDKFHLTVTTDY